MIDEEWTLKIQGECVGIEPLGEGLGRNKLVEVVSLGKVRAHSSVTDQ